VLEKISAFVRMDADPECFWFLPRVELNQSSCGLWYVYLLYTQMSSGVR